MFWNVLECQRYGLPNYHKPQIMFERIFLDFFLDFCGIFRTVLEFFQISDWTFPDFPKHLQQRLKQGLDWSRFWLLLDAVGGTGIFGNVGVECLEFYGMFGNFRECWSRVFWNFMECSGMFGNETVCFGMFRAFYGRYGIMGQPLKKNPL